MCCKKYTPISTKSGHRVCGGCRTYLGYAPRNPEFRKIHERYAQRRAIRRDEYRSGVEYREKMSLYAQVRDPEWKKQQSEGMKRYWARRRELAAQSA